MQPLRSADSIMWTIKFRNGNMQRLEFPIRATPEGSIKPHEGKSTVKMVDIVKPGTSPAPRRAVTALAKG